MKFLACKNNVLFLSITLFNLVFFSPLFSEEIVQRNISPVTIKENEQSIPEKQDNESVNTTNLTNVKTDNISKSDETNLLQETINYQNAIMNASSHWLAYLSIFLGLLGIGLPLLTYFLGIKPSQDQIKENKKAVEVLLQERQEKEIEKLFKDLKSDSISKKYQTARILSSYSNYAFNDYQIRDLIDVAENLNDNKSCLALINNLLACTDSKYTENYFNKLILNENNTQNSYYISIYLLGKDLTKFMSTIIEACKKSATFFTTFIFQLSSISSKHCIDVLNNVDISNALKTNYQNVLPMLKSINQSNPSLTIENTNCFRELSNYEKLQKQKIEEENRNNLQDKQEESQQKKDAIKEEIKKYYRIGNTIYDKSDKEIPQIDFVYDILTGNSIVKKGIQVSGMIIPVEKIEASKDK